MRASPSLALRAAQALRLRASAARTMRPSQARSMPQDMPPEGGYEAVQYKRNLPVRGFQPKWYIIGTLVIMTYGWYKYTVGIWEYNELAREKQWGRFHLLPLLVAEEDRDQVRRHYAEKEREKELLGSEAKIYNTDRFIRPTYTVTPPESK